MAFTDWIRHHFDVSFRIDCGQTDQSDGIDEYTFANHVTNHNRQIFKLSEHSADGRIKKK